MFDRPEWVVYVGVFFLVYLIASVWPHHDDAARNSRRNLVIAAGSICLYALWSIAAALALLTLCAGVYLYSQQSRLVRAVSAPLFIAASLAYLAFVKYWGFAADNLGIVWKHQLYVIGISFYVFTLVGYLVETAYRRHKPLPAFSHSVILLSFWPHLAAGPILRLENIREHIERKLELTGETLKLATILIIGGLGKKLFLADNLGTYVNANMDHGVAGMTGVDATATLLGFAAQIYFDFSGYSDIALGSALLMGFRLPANFNYPYRSRSFGEFWRRWHISLSTWFRDYLYVPLGGSRRGNLYINILIVFVLSGFWHGAAFHFVIWGLIHGSALCLERGYQWSASGAFRRLSNLRDAVARRSQRARDLLPAATRYVWRPLTQLKGVAGWTITTFVVLLAWAYFRTDWHQGNEWIAKVFDFRSYRHYQVASSAYYALPLFGLVPFLVVDHLFCYYRVESGFIRIRVTIPQMVYAAALFVLGLLFSGTGLPFIYIQF